MSAQVVNGASLLCSFGTAPAKLIVAPANRIRAEGQAAATIMDHLPISNIPAFGMCRSMANPQVASATAAALGVLTPMPCLPATSAPWAPGASKTVISKLPALGSTATCACTWAGVIQITDPATQKTNIL
ncbi:hypothetical protein D3C76_327400 [compost metagenome]